MTSETFTLRTTLLLFFCVNLIVVSCSEEKKGVFRADLDGEGANEISIRIGAKSDNGKDAIEVKADEGGGDGGGGSSGSNSTESQSESTTFDKCNFESGADCCFQYTWSGYVAASAIPEAQNATCEYLKKSRRDDTIACFDPMVFTKGRPDSKTHGTPPNHTELQQEAEFNNWNVYCIKSGKQCVSYSYYSPDRKKMLNQTNFCGIVTANDGGRASEGCYHESVGGTVREVCVCDKPLCNSSSSLKQPFLLFTIILVLNFFRQLHH